MNNPIKITIPIPQKIQGRPSCIVYRYHGDQVGFIASNQTPMFDGEYIT